jgi:hypothetical protein
MRDNEHGSDRCSGELIRALHGNTIAGIVRGTVDASQGSPGW